MISYQGLNGVKLIIEHCKEKKINIDVEKLNVIQNRINDLEQYTKEADFYAILAINMMPLNMYFWKIKAFVERDYTVWAIAKGDDEDAKYHYARFKEWWDRIEEAEERHGKNRMICVRN